MVNVDDIRAAWWSPKLGEHAEVVTDDADIAQCIRIIISTPKGRDALRPEFGCDMLRYIDMPVGEAIPGMIYAITEALRLWEPRIEVEGVTARLDGERVYASVQWRLIEGGTVETTEVTV